MQSVARACETFHLDPVVVLHGNDDFEITVRIAAARIVAEDERKRNEAQNRQSRGRKR